MAAGVTRLVAGSGPLTLSGSLVCQSDSVAQKRCQLLRYSRTDAGNLPVRLRPVQATRFLMTSAMTSDCVPRGPVSRAFQKHQDFRIETADAFRSLCLPCRPRSRFTSNTHKSLKASLRKEGFAAGKQQSKTCSALLGKIFPSTSPFNPSCRTGAGQTCCRQLRVLAVSRDHTGSTGDSEIPATSDEFLRKVSSQSYTSMSKQMQEKEDASFEVLEKNPWGEEDKTVFVLIQKEESLFTMKVRKDRSDVEREFTTLFPSLGGRQRWARPPAAPRPPAPSPAGDTREAKARFSMHVDTVCEGILVFEEEDEATRFCGLLETDGHEDLSVVETDAVELFSLCQKSKAVAIVFREGVMPPLPDRLRRALRARKYSLDD